VQIYVSGPSVTQFEDSKNNSYKILIKFKTRSFAEFSFKIHFKFEDISLEKVVSLFKPFNSIFYLKFFEPRKVPVGFVKDWMDLNFIQNCFDFVRIGLNRGTVDEAPPVSDPVPLF
jgi:hypothetical protein